MLNEVVYLQSETKHNGGKKNYHFVQNICISQNIKPNRINQAHNALQLTTSMKQKTFLR